MAQKEKKMTCECGRKSYVISEDCQKVTCWQCIQEELEKRNTKKENIPTEEKTLPSTLPSQLLCLPREERRRILASSAKKVAKHYAVKKTETTLSPPPDRDDTAEESG